MPAGRARRSVEPSGERHVETFQGLGSADEIEKDLIIRLASMTEIEHTLKSAIDQVAFVPVVFGHIESQRDAGIKLDDAITAYGDPIGAACDLSFDLRGRHSLALDGRDGKIRR